MATSPREYTQPDADNGPVIDTVYEAIKEWFPRSSQEARESLAFYIVHNVLQIRHVEGEVWTAFVSPVQPSDNPL